MSLLPPNTPLTTVREPIVVPNTTHNSLQVYLDMLRTKRPGRSQTENEFIDKYLFPIGCRSDKYGNMHITVGDAPDILWSSHTDTVHTIDGEQLIEIEGDYVRLAKPHGSKRKRRHYASNCLGADCTTGVWLMIEMIKAKVPGRYIFHADEESGGRGSSWIAENAPTFLTNIKAAIAFDRYGTSEVITHQYGTRMASDAFATSLASQLPNGLKPSEDGIFTDTANYPDHIGECTNIAVGYYGHHTSKERQDLKYLLELRDCLVKFDASKLTISRKPGDVDLDYGYGYGRYSQYGAWGFLDDWGTVAKTSAYSQLKDVSTKHITSTSTNPPARIIRSKTAFEELLFFVEHNPHETADFLEQMGIKVDDLRTYAPWIDEEEDV